MAYCIETSGNWNGKEVKIAAKKATGKTMFEVGLIVEGYAKTLSPVDTGRLAGSITTQARYTGSSPLSPASMLDVIHRPNSDWIVLVGTAVEYGPYIEFGTYRSQAQAFLRPALALARGQAITVAMHKGRLQLKEYLRNAA